MSGDPVEITELAIGDANIGSVHVAVDLPTHFSMGHLFFPEFVSHVHQAGQWGFLEQEQSLFCCQKLKVQCLLVQSFEIIHVIHYQGNKVRATMV
jgi:hypothetical protein